MWIKTEDGENQTTFLNTENIISLEYHKKKDSCVSV